LALGAAGSYVLRMVLGKGLQLLLAGIAIGLAASLSLSRVLVSQLGASPPTIPSPSHPWPSFSWSSASSPAGFPPGGQHGSIHPLPCGTNNSHEICLTTLVATEHFHR